MNVRDRSSLSPIRLSAGEMLVMCAAVLLVVVGGAVFRAAGSTWSNDAAWTIGGDFPPFYVAGRVLREHHGDRLYDLALQEEIYRAEVAGATSLTRSFQYPPFIAALFRPLAEVALPKALLIFLTVLPLLFLGAVALLSARFGPSARDERALVLLGSLSFFPFIGYSWLGAQISVVGFLSIAVAVCEEDRGRPFWSGLALAVCLYKPSLLVLILPMLLLSGRFRQLAGFLAGAGILTILSVTVVGSGAVVVFAQRLIWVAARSSANDRLFNPYRNVDLNAFFLLLPYGRSIAGRVTFGAIAAAAGIALVSSWLRSRTAGRPERLLVWAATLTFTQVLNIYAPFYDAVLVVAAAILAFAAVRARGWQGWNRLGPALLCVYVAPWFAEIVARGVNVQIYTLVLGGFGTLLLFEARKASGSQVPVDTQLVSRHSP